MTRGLRLGAIVIALAGLIDPVIALQRRPPVPVELRLPEPYDPGFESALRIKDALRRLLGPAVETGSSQRPRALVAIGNAVPPAAADVPMLVIQDTSSPRLAAVDLHAPTGVEGQQQTAVASFRANGLAGRSTEFVLRRRDARIASVSHRWSGADERFDVRLAFISPTAGLDVLRLTANTDGISPVVLDVPVAVSSRKLRVLAYEPRPSWGASFVRQALERDQVFELNARTETSRGIHTETRQAPAVLRFSDVETFDVLVIGGVEALTRADVDVLERFASLRGGTVVLLPDARIPEHVRAPLELPIFEEVLVDRAVDVQTSAAALRASEFLLPKDSAGRYRALATVRHLGTERAAVLEVVRGSGQVVVSGLLDGWRFRAENSGGFDSFWRGAIADAALLAPPPVTVAVNPVVAPPGDQVRIRVSVRATEWEQKAGEIDVPSVTASLIAMDGTTDPIRLWPAATPGVYETSVAAPPGGRYSIRVSGSGGSAEAPLLVETSAAPVTPDHLPALSALARASGGERFDAAQLEAVAKRLQQIGPPPADHRVHPMRSGWWMLPFAGLLTAEWTLRRRRGQR